MNDNFPIIKPEDNGFAIYQIKNLSDKNFEACKKEIENFVISKLKTAAIDDPIYKQYLMLNKIGNATDVLDLATKEYFKKFASFDLIDTEDITKPRYIFDRHNEIVRIIRSAFSAGIKQMSRFLSGSLLQALYSIRQLQQPSGRMRCMFRD